MTSWFGRTYPQSGDVFVIVFVLVRNLPNKMTHTSRICAFPGLRAYPASSWNRCHISKLFIDGKRQGHTTTMPWLDVQGIHNRRREHSKTRLKVLEPGCARTLATWDLFISWPEYRVSQKNDCCWSLVHGSFPAKPWLHKGPYSYTSHFFKGILLDGQCWSNMLVQFQTVINNGNYCPRFRLLISRSDIITRTRIVLGIAFHCQNSRN
jgi:hypothetical protein